METLSFYRLYTMSILLNACNFYSQLLNKNYSLILGFKGKEQAITIIFRKNDFKHLIGLQYLKDLQQLKTQAIVLYNKIQKQEITIDELEKSTEYEKHVKSRLDDFSHIFPQLILQLSEGILDIYRCSSLTVQQHSKIKADYMLVFKYNHNRFYLFLLEDELNHGFFYPISFFREEQSYTKNNHYIQHMTTLKCIEYSAKNTFIHKNYKKRNKQNIHQIILEDFD